MASALFDKGREAFLAGDIDYPSDTIKIVAVDTSDYTVDLAAHDFLDDIPSGARIATATLAGKTATSGVADCSDITLTAVSGDAISAAVVYKDTGSEATSPLIAYIELGPVTPNGMDITLLVDDGPDKLFKL
jgi:hypothetical protein